MIRTLVAPAVVCLGLASVAAAQSAGPPPAPAPVSLTLEDAIQRGLASNVAVRVEEQKVRSAEASRQQALGALLPHLSANVRASDQLLSTAAFGFTSFPGFPTLIGPFSVLDARVALSASVFDPSGLADLHGDDALVHAETHALRTTRDAVTLTVADLYLEALADASRVDAAAAQVATADALEKLAADQKASGLVAGIDVVRQQVQVQSARQRLLVAQNAFDKQKLLIGHEIGLTADQPITLMDHITYTASPVLTLAGALAQAYAARDDLQTAQAKVDAAQSARRSAAGTGLPSVHFDADYGALGPTPGTLAGTYTVAANVHVPIFQGGEVRGRVQQADADLREREAELTDLRSGIAFEIAAALLDLQTAAAAVDVSKSAQALAGEELLEARDRFQAGVASTIELVNAEDAVASASDSYIASVYAHNLAKGALARAMGVVDTRLTEFLGGRR